MEEAGVLAGLEGVPRRGMEFRDRGTEGVSGSLPLGIIWLVNSISGDPGGVFNKEADGIVGRGGICGRMLELFLGEHSAELGAVAEELELDVRDDEVVDEVEAKDCAELEETERNEFVFLSPPSTIAILEESRFLELDLEASPERCELSVI